MTPLDDLLCLLVLWLVMLLPLGLFYGGRP
jgi:hypothetical protein